MRIETGRIYDLPRPEEEFRVLVDRLWPRGLKKNAVRVDLWLKDIAPSSALRKWFAHEPAKWEHFKERYFSELEGKQHLVNQLLEIAVEKPIVLLYGARDVEHNQAVALKEYIEKRGKFLNSASGTPPFGETTQIDDVTVSEIVRREHSAAQDKEEPRESSSPVCYLSEFTREWGLERDS